MSVVVVATVHPIAEHRDEVLAAFVDAIGHVHAEDDGCELYALHEGPDRLVMIEKWSSAEALKAHGATDVLKTLGAALAGKTVGALDVQVLTPHPAGTAELGTL
jgi:quinol monooxygenase YgiN